MLLPEAALDEPSLRLAGGPLNRETHPLRQEVGACPPQEGRGEVDVTAVKPHMGRITRGRHWMQR